MTPGPAGNVHLFLFGLCFLGDAAQTLLIARIRVKLLPVQTRLGAALEDRFIRHLKF